MDYLNNLQKSIEKHCSENAFCINNTFYTYADFALEISKIRLSISNSVDFSNKLIGLVLNDDIKTYAAIIAIWLEGKAYVSINPEHPEERNKTILNSTEATYFYDSVKKIQINTIKHLQDLELSNIEINLRPNSVEKNNKFY